METINENKKTNISNVKFIITYRTYRGFCRKVKILHKIWVLWLLGKALLENVKIALDKWGYFN